MGFFSSSNDDGDKFDIEVIDRQEEENGDYSFTFIMTPREP